MRNRMKNLYKRFLILWYSSIWVRLIIALLYLGVIKYIFIKYYGPLIPYQISEDIPLEIKKPAEKGIPEIKNIPKIIDMPKLEHTKVEYNRATDYFAYFQYFPSGDDTLENYLPFTGGSLPDPFSNVIIDHLTYEQTPKFIVSAIDNGLSKTKVNPPPILDTSLPFDAPIIITVSEDLSIIPKIDYSIQQDMLSSIYAPSYIGEKSYVKNQIFELHTTILQDVTHRIKETFDKEGITSPTRIQEIAHTAVQEYMIRFQIYDTLTVQNLRNTEHFVNLLLNELIINSIFSFDQDQFILHSICKAILFEVINKIEHVSNWDDERYMQILARFLESSPDALDTPDSFNS